MDKFKIFDSSPAATAVKVRVSEVGAEKYPWRHLPVGKSFFIEKTETSTKISTIRTSCVRWSKKLGRHFRAVEHAEGIEVARLPDPQAPEKNALVASSVDPRPIPAATVHAGWPDPYKPVEDKPSVGTDQPFVSPWGRADK